MVKQNKNIDILKYLMSIMIIMIHVGYSFEIPILRAAVPVFFIISSYFFFKKINCTTANEHKQILINFIKRASKLYLFWFIVLLPVTIVKRRWYQDDMLAILWNFIRGVTLGSTFPASWYITAYIIGICLIYEFQNKKLIIGLISLCSYLLCTLSSNYYYLFDIQFLKWGGVNLYNSFPVGLVFIYIGMILAKVKKPTIAKGFVGIVVGITLLYIENYLILKYNLRRADDCYLSLLVLSPSIFIFSNSLPNIVKANTTILRNMSTIYYCSHFSMIIVIRVIFGQLPQYDMLLITLVSVSILSVSLLCISRFKSLSWVKYSY